MTTWADLGIDEARLGPGNVKMPCPSCGPTRNHPNDPSLSVNRDEGCFKCHNCNWAGSLKSRDHIQSGPDFKQKVERQDWKRPDASRFRAETTTDLPSDILGYFKARGISETTLRANGVAFGPGYDFGFFRTLKPGEPGYQDGGRNQKWEISKGRNGLPVQSLYFPYEMGGELINIKKRLWADGTAQKDFRLTKGALKIFWGIDNADETTIIVEGECLTGDAEVLTPDGWVRFDQYDGQAVAQWNEDGTLEMVKPIASIAKPYSGDLVRHTNQQRYYSLATPGHNMVAVDQKGRIRKHRADGRISESDVIPRVGVLDGPGIDLSDDQIALILAVSADASIRIDGDTTKWHYGGKNYAVFGFKKQRKVERLVAILDRLGLKYHRATIANGYEYVNLILPDWIPGIGKLLPHDWLAALSLQQREFILREMVEWDGNSVNGRAQSEYSTKIEENAIWMQTLAHTAGMTSTVMRHSNAHGSWLKVSVLHRKRMTSWQSIKTESVPFDGTVYCVQVPSGAFLVRQDGCISVTGNCDLLTLYECGYYNAISVPNGASVSEYLDACAEQLAKVKRFILMVDGDEAGQKLRDELARRLGKENCMVVEYPPEAKDINEVLVRYGQNEVDRVVRSARFLPVEGLVELSDVSDEIDYYYEHGMPTGLTTGLPSLDPIFRVGPGAFVIVTGKPSQGKSSVLAQILLHMAELHDIQVGVFSPEDNPTSAFMIKLLMKKVGKSFEPGKPNRMTPEEMVAAKAWLQDHFVSIAPSETTFSVDEILRLARVAVYRRGIRALVIDPWNEIDHNRPARLSEGEYISQVLSKLRIFARMHDCAVFLVAHPRKTEKIKTKDGEVVEAVVDLEEIAGSFHFRAKADIGLTVWRDVTKTGPDAVTKIYVTKCRQPWYGKLGVAEFAYDPVSGRIVDPLGGPKPVVSAAEIEDLFDGVA